MNGATDASAGNACGRVRRAVSRIFLAAGFALLASGCGAIRFNRAWSRFESAAYDGGMAGRWKGEWRSEWNGHSGGLRCLMTRQAEDHYLAWFFSTYGWFFFFQHETVFHVVGDEAETLRFEGEQDLGKLVGGVYRYAGTATPDVFHATFRAENGDEGVFEMQRVD